MKKDLHKLIDTDKIEFAALKVKLIANYNRCAIINLLTEAGEMNITMNCEKLNASITTIKKELTLLCDDGILQETKRGIFVYYKVNTDRMQLILGISESLYNKN